MTRPDLCRCQLQRVHIHHGLGREDLFPGHLSDVKTRSDFARLFVREPNENVGVLARFTLYRLVQGWQQRRTAPIVDDSVTFGNAIEVRSYNDGLVGAAR
jgi:hypothetical protein